MEEETSEVKTVVCDWLPPGVFVFGYPQALVEFLCKKINEEQMRQRVIVVGMSLKEFMQKHLIEIVETWGETCIGELLDSCAPRRRRENGE
jgi:hypothetical protein